MKKYFSVLGILFVLMLSAGQVLAQNSDYALSTVPLAQIVNGDADGKIVNKSGMTGKTLREMLDAWCKQRAGIDLYTLVTQGDVSDLKDPHFNTQSYPDGIQVYFDRTPNGKAWSWNNVQILKEECCNLIGSDPSIIRNFLANYTKKSNNPSSEKKYKIENGDFDRTDGISDKKENNMRDTTIVQVVLDGGSATNNTTPNNELLIFAILALLAIVVLFLFALAKRNNTNNNVRNVNTTLGPTVQSMETQWAVEDEIFKRFTNIAKQADIFRDERNASMIDGHTNLSNRFNPANRGN